jgi:uncharacterized cupin superfamily protein
MDRFNVFTTGFEYAATRPAGYRCGTARIGPAIGARRIAATIYEVPTGESSVPYHYEYGAEEWAIVLAGTPTLRRPDGEKELAPGDTVCFAEGPDGAHKFTNHADDPARVMILSTYGRPAVAVFPDSDKVGVWPNGEGPLLVERSSGVDYWKGEA